MMSEVRTITSAATFKRRSEESSLGQDNLLSVFESLLSPLSIICALCAVTLHYEGSLYPPYLILAVMVFALTYPGRSRLLPTIWHVVGDILVNWFWVAGLLAITGLLTGYIKEFSSDALLTWLWFAPVVELAGSVVLRATAPALLKLQGTPQRALIVGMNEQGMALARKLRATPLSRIEFVGFVDSREASRLHHHVDGDASYRLLGKLNELAELVRSTHAQIIYLSLPMASQPRILQLLDELKDTTASIYFVPDMFVTDLIQGHPEAVCGMPVISVCETPFRGSDGALKRISDLVFSLLILIMIAPLLLAIAIAIKATSPGPIIFKQRRYGLDGEEILVYKFRSMSVTEDGGSIKQAQKNDARITPLGAFLRKTSLDELPQFVNVLQGRMSIVGPRPHAVAHNEMYRKLIKGYMVRHKVKPGITGWAQVNGFRGETETLDKMQGRINYDLDYLRHWSLRLDIHIILRTVRLVAKDSQAY
jgi:putative colanic acid biosynthesis UDP-glucose lipid carrier transferase